MVCMSLMSIIGLWGFCLLVLRVTAGAVAQYRWNEVLNRCQSLAYRNFLALIVFPYFLTCIDECSAEGLGTATLNTAFCAI